MLESACTTFCFQYFATPAATVGIMNRGGARSWHLFHKIHFHTLTFMFAFTFICLFHYFCPYALQKKPALIPGLTLWQGLKLCAPFQNGDGTENAGQETAVYLSGFGFLIACCWHEDVAMWV